MPPAHTVGVPGGSQALRRTERVAVRVGRREGMVPRPDLLGAILIKARAVEVSSRPDAQLQDLAFLCALVEDPRALRAQMAHREPGWLRRRHELVSPDAPAWRLLGQAADDAHRAFRLLAREA